MLASFGAAFPCCLEGLKGTLLCGYMERLGHRGAGGPCVQTH